VDSATLKKMIIKIKLAISAVEISTAKLPGEAKKMAKEASEKRAAGDRRAAVDLMFKRRIILRKIESHDALLKRLHIALDKLVFF